MVSDRRIILAPIDISRIVIVAEPQTTASEKVKLR